MAELKIRCFSPDDWEVLHGMMQKLHLLHAEKRPDIFRADADPFTEEEFQELFQNPNRLSLAAELDGELAGFCMMELKRTSNPILQKKTIAFVEALYISEQYRKLGIGRSLMERAKNLARQNGAGSLQLRVWGFNRSAIDFYQSMGMTLQSMTLEEPLE